MTGQGTSLNGESLEKEVMVEGAENVAISFKLAGLGSRIMAGILDYLIQLIPVMFLTFMVFIIASYGATSGRDMFSVSSLYIISALIMVLSFLIYWGYFIIFELIWQGQTPGKKVMKIKVIRDDGRPLNFMSSFLRNILRVLDMLPFYYLAGLVSAFFHYREKRLGDLVGGTIVVKTPDVFPGRVLFKKYTRSPEVQKEFPGLEKQLYHLDAKETELLRDYLRRRYEMEIWPRKRFSRELAEHFAARLGYPVPRNSENFLEELYALVYFPDKS